MVLDVALGVLLALALLIGGFFLFVFLASHAKQIAKAIGIAVALSVAVIAFIVVREQFPQPSEQTAAPAYQKPAQTQLTPQQWESVKVNPHGAY